MSEIEVTQADQELLDELTEAISDSSGPDWNCADGAKAVFEIVMAATAELEAENARLRKENARLSGAQELNDEWTDYYADLEQRQQALTRERKQDEQG